MKKISKNIGHNDRKPMSSNDVKSLNATSVKMANTNQVNSSPHIKGASPQQCRDYLNSQQKRYGGAFYLLSILNAAENRDDVVLSMDIAWENPQLNPWPDECRLVEAPIEVVDNQAIEEYNLSLNCLTSKIAELKSCGCDPKTDPGIIEAQQDYDKIMSHKMKATDQYGKSKSFETAQSKNRRCEDMDILRFMNSTQKNNPEVYHTLKELLDRWRKKTGRKKRPAKKSKTR